MEGGNVLDVLRTMKTDHAHIPVLILSMYPEEQYAMRLLKAGAAGYLTKESVTDELITAVNQVLSGKKYISASLAGELASDPEGRAQRPLHETLSDREFQVMLMIASGDSVKEIADRESLSAKTVSTYRTRILTKMNMKSNADIVRYAIVNGLIE